MGALENAKGLLPHTYCTHNMLMAAVEITRSLSCIVYGHRVAPIYGTRENKSIRVHVLPRALLIRLLSFGCSLSRSVLSCDDTTCIEALEWIRTVLSVAVFDFDGLLRARRQLYD